MNKKSLTCIGMAFYIVAMMFLSSQAQAQEAGKGKAASKADSALGRLLNSLSDGQFASMVLSSGISAEELDRIESSRQKLSRNSQDEFRKTKEEFSQRIANGIAQQIPEFAALADHSKVKLALETAAEVQTTISMEGRKRIQQILNEHQTRSLQAARQREQIKAHRKAAARKRLIKGVREKFGEQAVAEVQRELRKAARVSGDIEALINPLPASR